MTFSSADSNAERDRFWMNRALSLAAQAQQAGEVPVGAVVVKDEEVVGEGWNQPIAGHDPTAHAEIVALRAAGQRLRNYRLVDCTLYVTLEPCVMCVGALVHARLRRVVFGAYDPKAGGITSVFSLADRREFNHRLQWQGGIMQETCGKLLSEFFAQRRASTR